MSIRSSCAQTIGQDRLPGRGQSTKNTWHHHQNGTTMQEVPSRIHRKFTHRGGVSFIKRSCSKD
ncbi:HNH endonuclease [Kosakonia sp. SMBL-WEM22]|nr:HNH endonuclease [Kosakonia sp. SMBL-WEM22]